MMINRDWKKILTKAWSIRLMVVAALLSGIEATIPFIEYWLPIPGGVFAFLSMIVTGAAFVTRLMAQKEFDDACTH